MRMTLHIEKLKGTEYASSLFSKAIEKEAKMCVEKYAEEKKNASNQSHRNLVASRCVESMSASAWRVPLLFYERTPN